MTKDREFYKKLRELMIPIAFQSFMLAAVSAGDSAMLGFADEKAMAAVSLASNIQFVENLFLGAIVGGGTIMTAQYWGKGAPSIYPNTHSYKIAITAPPARRKFRRAFLKG